MIPDDDVTAAPASLLATRIRNGDVSSREVVQRFLDRIDEVDPRVHSCVVVDRDGALAAAAAADERLASGGAVGPLHGVPITIKDCFEIAGLPVTAGIEARLAQACAADAPTVALLRRAGAVILGTTATPVLLADVQTYNPIVGVTNNPHDPARSAGGSSGGTGAAIAAGMAPFGLGSDLSGSIRVPSAWCGVAGLKPSFGIVSKRGHVPGRAGAYPSADVSVAGPMGRTTADVALLLDVLAGPEAEMAPAWRLHLPEPRSRDARRLRVGIWHADPARPVSADVAAAVDAAAAALRGAGATVVDTALDGGLASLLPNFAATTAGEITANLPLDEWREIVAALGPAAPGADPLERIHAQSHREWVEHESERQVHQARIAAWLADLDAVVCPIVPVPAIPHDTETASAERTFDLDGSRRPYGELTGWNAIGTVGAVPVAVVTVAQTAGGLPVAVQVVAKYLEDRTALAVAGLLEQRCA